MQGTLNTVRRMLGVAECVQEDAIFSGVTLDSRTVAPGNLFIALRGARFDAHDFLHQVAAAGAVAAVVEKNLPDAPLRTIQVGDTHAALGRLAAAHRAQYSLPLLAVTGSNGKTTVKEMIASILRVAFSEACVLATAGNLNNEIGVPLTLLRLQTQHRAAVLELGMNHPGEIAHLAAWVAPTVALVNNAQREHQEFMQSVEAVARENGSVFAALPEHGYAVFPADDAYAPLWRSLAGSRPQMRFALNADAEVHGTYTLDEEGSVVQVQTPQGNFACTLSIVGEHNVRNALAATASCLAAGVPLPAIAQGLTDFRPVKGRLQVCRGRAGVRLIDDTYNANPDSVRAAIDVLATQTAPRWLVLGDMGEVGKEGAAYHSEIGAYARQRGIERLFALGEQSACAVEAFGVGATHYPSLDALVTDLDESPLPHSVLVKGSRFMRMEAVVAHLAS